MSCPCPCMGCTRAYKQGLVDAELVAREQAIRDCITEVAELTEKGDSVRPGDVMYVLSALLDNEQEN